MPVRMARRYSDAAYKGKATENLLRRITWPESLLRCGVSGATEKPETTLGSQAIGHAWRAYFLARKAHPKER